MNCLICKAGTTEAARTTVTIDRDGLLLVIRDVPAQICTNCGEKYFDSPTTDHILATAEKAFASGAELEIVRLKAA